MKSDLGDLLVPLCSPNKICQICSFPSAVKRHIGISEAQSNIDKINFKIQELKDQSHTLDPLLIEVRLSRIHGLATDLLMNVENKWRKFRTGEVNYYPETDMAGKTWHFWIF